MTNPASDSAFHASDVAVCFLHGILRRSGTNYLFRLLQEHPEVYGPGPIWEDYLLHFAGPVREYVDSLYDRWKEHWEIAQEVGPPGELQRHLGNALRGFLLRQLDERSAPKGRHSERRRQAKILLTKTPSVQGIEDFFGFFPEDFLLVLVRDGRAVVESGVRSFGWEYESAMRAWARGAEQILQAANKFERTDKPFLLVRYEDVFRDEKGALEKICSFLGRDRSLCRFDRLAGIKVVGSSDLMKSDGRIHWEEKERTGDFDPLSRFSDWDREQHALFNRIAGEYMERLGYELT